MITMRGFWIPLNNGMTRRTDERKFSKLGHVSPLWSRIALIYGYPYLTLASLNKQKLLN